MRIQWANVFVLVMLTGCGSGTYPVRGQVVFEDDSPADKLVGYMVNFQAADKKASASGVVQADGTFTVSTFKEGDGALPGVHRVALTKPIVYGDDPRPPELILKQYQDFSTSPLEVEIKSGSNPIILKVERLKK